MTTIFKVITNYKEWEKMEEINNITGVEPFDTDNWCDMDQFELHPELKKYVSEEEFEALKNGQTDYIAFRIDR